MAKKGMNIYKRKDSRWEGRYKPPGCEKYRSVYGKTFGEVKEKLIKLQNQTITPSLKCRLTVKELFELWLNSVRHKIKDSSYAGYLMKLEVHIYPALGGLKFEALTSKHIDDFVNEKLTGGRIGGGSLSAKYVSDMVILLKSMGKFAEREYGYRNPILNANTPKVRRQEINTPTKHEQDLLKSYLLNNLSLRNLGVLLCLFTGIRIGELCALKWSDIDFNEGVLRITKTVQRIKSFDGKSRTELVITSPKSGKSVREIPLPDSILTLLSEYRQAPDCYILSGNVKLIEPRLMQYYFKTVLKKAKPPSINFHMFRHIFATNCIACGFDVKTLSEILGHSSVELTLNRYVHSSKERKRECMERLNFAA